MAFIRPLLLSLLLLALLQPMEALSADEPQLRYVMDESPPFTFTYLEKPTGLGTEVLRLIWKELGIKEQPIQVMPWPRAITLVEREPDVCLFVASWTPAGALRFKFVKPVYSSTVSVLVDTRQVGSMGCLEALRSLNISLPRMEHVSQELLDRGTPPGKLDHATTMATAVRLAVRGRVQAIAGEESAIREHLDDYYLQCDRFERVCVFNRREMGFMFSSNVSDRVIERFQQALDTVRKTEEYSKLLEKYLP